MEHALVAMSLATSYGPCDRCSPTAPHNIVFRCACVPVPPPGAPRVGLAIASGKSDHIWTVERAGDVGTLTPSVDWPGHLHVTASRIPIVGIAQIHGFADDAAVGASLLRYRTAEEARMSRFDYRLTRYRLPEDGEKFEPESVNYGEIEHALGKLAEWSDGKFVVLSAAEYAAMRASYEAALEGAGDRDAPTTGEPELSPAATTAESEPQLPPQAIGVTTAPTVEEAPLSTAYPEPAESGLAGATRAVDEPITGGRRPRR